MPSVRSAHVLWALCSLLPAQAPVGAAIADALRRSDHAAAAALAAAEPDLGRRAMLEAALVPLADRPAAMLAVAQRFAGEPVAATALHAGLAAAAYAQGRAGSLPGVAAAFEALGDDDHATRRDAAFDLRLAQVLPQLLAVHRRWEAEHAGDPAAAELRHLARLCATQCALLDPVPVAADDAWPVPRPLADDLLVSVRALGDTMPDLRDVAVALDREPEARWLIAAKEPPAELRCPRPGRWLLEVQSLQSPWRSVRVVDAGWLGATVLVDGGVLAFAADGARLDDEREVVWSLWSGQQQRTGGARGGAGVWQLAADVEGSHVVQARSGDERARVRVYVPERRAVPREPFVAHWQFDRPLHRPGETLRGRVVVRRVVWAGDGWSAVPATAALGAQAMELRGKWSEAQPFAVAVATDARGLAEFTLPIPDDAAPGGLALALVWPDGRPCVRSLATEVANFVRPAMVAAIDGPARVPPGDESATVTLRVQWASGGAAAGVSVLVTVAAGDVREERRLQTGSDGALSIPIAVAERAGQTIHCACAVQGADGHVERLAHTIAVDGAEPPKPSAAGLGVELPREVVVGEDATVLVRGTRYTDALVVVGRGANARAASLSFGGDDREAWTVRVTAADWPRLFVAATNGEGHEPVTGSAPVRLRARVPLQLTAPATARPKETLRCRAQTAPHSLVTFAVADDRIFRIAADRTRAPDGALRPWVAEPEWIVARSAEAIDAARVLGELLVDGRVPGPGDLRVPPRGAGGSAGPSGPSTGAAELRSDFRATVCFVTAVADANGVAEAPIELPDDVTTWRVTVTSVDDFGEGELAVVKVIARLPLAAEPVLPRLLREGDHVEVPVVLDRAHDAGGAAAVVFVAQASGGLQIAAGARSERAVPAGTAGVVPFTVRAAGVGDAQVQLAATAGEWSDRSQRALPVLPDAIVMPLVASAAGHGVVEVAAPSGRDMDAPLQLSVLAGGAAAWQQLAQRLEQYPYGCVEQTLSRLLPFAAAASGERDAARAERIGRGMARLRQLQVARGGAFAWWPGQRADLRMTGLVLHGLAALRAGGVDPAAYGINIDADGLRAHWQAGEAPADVDRVELLAGLLRFLPQHAGLHGAAAALVDARTPMSRGASVRLALALAAAGDGERARRCATEPALRSGEAAVWLPGEDALVVQAQRLELARALGDAVDAADEVALVRSLLAGGCRTYADGAALVALAPMLRSSPAGVQLRVTVDGGVPALHAVRSEQGGRLQLALPAARHVAVQCGDAEQVLFVQLAARATRPAVGDSWAGPFVVERQLLAADERGGWREVHGNVTAGERLRVRLHVTAPAPAQYVALVCALPAGFELLDDRGWLQRFDDRVVATFARLAGGERARVEFDVVAALAGSMLWPPATAEAMYDAAASGGSQGVRLTVVPRSIAAAAKVAAFLQPPPPKPALPVSGEVAPPPPTMRERANAAWSELSAIWCSDLIDGIYGFDEVPDADTHARIDAAFAALQQLLEHDDAAVLAEIEWLVTPGRQRGGALAPWRCSLLERLEALVTRGLELAVARVERRLDDGGRASRVLERLPAGRREATALRLLRRWWPDAPGGVEDVLAALAPPARDPALVAFLETMLATADGDVLDGVLALLPESSWAALPASALIDLAARCGYGGQQARVMRWALRTAAGVQEAVRRAGDPAFVERLAWSELPDELLLAIPVTALATMADDEPARTAALLAAGPTPTAELWRLLLQRGEALPLAVVVDAVRRRGPIVLPDTTDVARIADPTVRTLVLALSAPDDAVGLAAVLAAARGLMLVARDGAVDELVGARLAHHGDAEQLVEFHEWLSSAHWAQCWPRLDPVSARRLLAAKPACLEYGVPASADVLVSMLEHASACGCTDDAVEAMLATPAGEARLRAALPRLAADAATEVREELADWLALDAATLQPAGETLDRVVPFAAVRGWSGEWPLHLAAARDRLLRLRGLALAPPPTSRR